MNSLPASSCGLLIAPPDEPFRDVARQIPLTGVRIDAKVTGPAGRVRVVQSYENREDQPVESVYVFPLEERSAVCGFAVTIDGKRIEGRVKERDKAFDDYDDAMLEGHGAFLLDQERPNVFTASVGNLMPGQKAEIEIDYVAELDRTDDGVRLMIPTTVSPRYVPQSMSDADGQEKGDRVNPPATTDDLPYGLTLEVEADLLSPIRAIESPSHTIHSEIDGTRVRVELAGNDRALDRDFVLLLKPAEAARPYSCLVTGPEEERFVLASFRPTIECERTPVEVLFLVDCSGSMHGVSMEEARRTLRLCLRSLMPGDHFNIVRFGSNHDRIFRKSRAYDEASLEQADRVVTEMDADLGGTEIMRPLRELLDARAPKGLHRRIVLLTDGQVADENDLIALARQHRDTTRIYAFGIGHGASEHLVRGLARASNGEAEFVAPGERIEDKVMRHFRRLALPTASGVRLEWEGLEVQDMVPKTVPSFGPGDTVTFLARVTGGESGSVRIAGEIAGRPIEAIAEIGAVSAEAGEDKLVPVLWARRRIQELEEGDTWTARQGSQQAARVQKKAERERKAVQEELVRLGETHSLISSVTSFVAVEEREESERAKDRAEFRQIPVSLTRGWGGVDPRYLRVARRQKRQSFGMACDLMSDATPRLGNEARFSKVIAENRFRGALRASSHSEPAKPDRWFELLMTQHADGSWEITADLAKHCGHEREQLEEVAAQCKEPWASRALATLLVLELAERHGAPPASRPILEKGRAWLAITTAQVSPPEPHSTWQDWADQISI